VGLKSTEVTASGSGVLKGAADALAGAVAAAEGVCTRASDLLRLVHEHLMPGVSEVPEGLDALVAAFGRKGERVGELVSDSLVSGSSTALAVLMGRGVSIDEAMVNTLPDYTPELLERADELTLLLQKTVDAQIPSTEGEGGGQ
jgi:hypothetical protein